MKVTKNKNQNEINVATMNTPTGVLMVARLNGSQVVRQDISRLHWKDRENLVGTVATVILNTIELMEPKS